MIRRLPVRNRLAIALAGGLTGGADHGADGCPRVAVGPRRRHRLGEAPLSLGAVLKRLPQRPECRGVLHAVGTRIVLLRIDRPGRPPDGGSLQCCEAWSSPEVLGPSWQHVNDDRPGVGGRNADLEKVAGRRSAPISMTRPSSSSSNRVGLLKAWRIASSLTPWRRALAAMIGASAYASYLVTTSHSKITCRSIRHSALS